VLGVWFFRFAHYPVNIQAKVAAAIVPEAGGGELGCGLPGRRITGKPVFTMIE